MKKKALLAVPGGVAIALLAAGPAFGQEFDPSKTTTDVYTLAVSTNLLWVVIGAVLVIFMQAGFALVETGFCRAKHAAHVVSTNFAIFGLGFVGFFFVGFPLAFGGYSYVAVRAGHARSASALIGSGNWVFLWKGGWALSGGGITPALRRLLPLHGGVHGHRQPPSRPAPWPSAGSGTASSAGACSAAPSTTRCSPAWTWGGGWLAKVWDTMSLGAGYVDFAGSGVVHMVGGVAGLAGALVLGPRIGKFAKDGTPRALPGHHIPMAMLGTFILLFGWFGFNAASTLASTDVQFAVVATNTAIAGGLRRHHRHVLDHVPHRQAGPGHDGQRHARRPGRHHRSVRLRGPVGGRGHRLPSPRVLVIESVFFVERKLKVDDPVGAISVHGVCGCFGVLAVGIFANGSYGAGWNGSDSAGVEGIIKGDWGQLGAQAARSAGHRHRHLRHRLRLLQDPERPDEGRHPPDARGRAWPAWTCPRWACSPTPSSRAPTAGSGRNAPAGAPASSKATVDA